MRAFSPVTQVKTSVKMMLTGAGCNIRMLTAATQLLRFKSGNHICVFYRDESYLLDLLAPYLAEGLQRGEKCFCAQKREHVEQIKERLVYLGINLNDELRRGSLEIHTQDEVYFSTGAFSPEEMMRLLNKAITGAKASGFTGLRTAGEMSWAAYGRCDCDQLLSYEAQVDEAFPGQPVVGMCQYDMRCFSPEVLARVLERHSSGLAETGSRHSTFTIRSSGYLADVIADRKDPRSRFYYVAQASNSADVLGWGTEASFDNAVLSAESLLTALTGLHTRRIAQSSRSS
jgi:MEDS: MEthanogen/methylotroph, DcmR Sensory domain